ncbi:AAA family ATPase [Desmospora profundinema]|uniref:Exonuclease SbcC n=1 Tax=Desmospora profundinema TaxID=1571184 RepID=A0ABU1IJC1_9BACL|nr:AAA family ATPase [Desmospora profundinema]MDR6224259.1 exonuclease SbcC [Desmospora profundinema]
MKGFQRVVIENFQSHGRTEIDLTDGLNVFVGPSDSGKSAILRALRWLLYNQPRGSDFIRAGKDRCRVALTLTDGVTIVRERSPSVNRYTLRDPDGNERVFEGFGGNVPLEVMEAHGMHPLKMDTDWNLPAQFGTQLEGPFLLSETGGVKAKSIGRVSGAHLIDLALQSTAKDQKNLAVEMRHLSREVERLDEALKPYAPLPEQVRVLAQSESRYAEAKKKEEVLNRLLHLRESWALCKEKKKKTRRQLDSLESLPMLESRLTGMEEGLRRTKELLRIRRQFHDHRRERERTEKVLKETARCEEAELGLQDLGEAVRRLASWVELRERHSTILREREGLIRLRDEAKQADAISVDAWEERLQRLRKLERLSPRLKQLSRTRRNWEGWIKRTEHLPAKEMERITADMERLRTLRGASDRLTDLRRRLSEGKKFRRQKEEEMETGVRLLVDAFRRLGRCPTCGSPVNGDVVEHIMEEVGGGWSRAAAGTENQRDEGQTG